MIRIVLSVTIFLLAALYKPVIHHSLVVSGVWRSPSPLGNANCTKIEGLQACEKIVVHSPSGIVYLACSTPVHRAHWGPYVLRFNDSLSETSTADYVATYDPSQARKPSKAIKRLKLKGFGDPRGLHVHGMDVVPARNNPALLYVYLVNHRPQLATSANTSAEIGADSVIEVFSTKLGSDTLLHIKTVRDPRIIITPNDISGSPDGNSFFFTNDHAVRIGRIRYWQWLFNLAVTSVGYCHLEHGCKVAAPSLRAANGITRVGDNTFYVTNSLGGQIVVFERNENNTLTQTESINIGQVIDNITIDEEGSIYAAAFLDLWRFKKLVMGNGKDPSPSSVFKITVNSGTLSPDAANPPRPVYSVQKIFEDDGTLASGITTAFADSQRRRLYLHGLIAPWLVSCAL